MSNAVTTITDENGIQREYRQIKCKAAIGERVIVTDGNYVVLEPLSSAISPPTDELLTLVSSLAANFAALDKRIKVLEGAESELKPLTRLDVIDRAKADVAKLVSIGGDSDTELPCESDFYATYYNVEFVINSAKRAVVALIRGRYGASVRATGKSRCTVDDVFNAHIGKAIALRRALGLAVPTEYTNAPQPTEVQIGDVVSAIGGIWRGESGVVSAVRPSGYAESDRGLTIQGIGWSYIHNVQVTDDSRLSEVA